MIKLFKLNTGDDVIGKVIPQVNKHSGLIEIHYPMYILTDVSESGYPLVALKLMNFYGAAPSITMGNEAIVYSTAPRSALEQFYTHTVEHYSTYYSARIDRMLQNTLDQYIESHEQEESDLLTFFQKNIPTGNTSIQ